MEDLYRVKKVIKYLIFREFAESEAEIANKLGYTKSSFSSIVNGKVPLSDKFLAKLCSVDGNINEDWVKTGKGKMLSNYGEFDIQVTIPLEVWLAIKNQSESLSKKDEQIDRLINMLKH